MVFKINISEKSGKTYKLEAEAPALIDKELNQTIQGKDISPDLEGYELEITGTSDNAGFTSMEEVDGIGLTKVLLTYGKGLHQKPKGEKKKGSKPKGLRMRKTVRGRIISPAISQINLKVLKEGSKKLEQIFSDQNKPKESEEAKPETEALVEKPAASPDVPSAEGKAPAEAKSPEASEVSKETSEEEPKVEGTQSKTKEVEKG
jgi:small subunit ribosomal protein S6e